MTKQEKQLLLIDLCARLPYGVKLRYVEDLVVKKESHIITLNNIYLEHILNGDADIKPYLRPMSSMTNQEIETYRALIGSLLENSVTDNVATLYNFLNSKHLDYRGMIHMGLALEAPEGMYKTN